MSEKGYEPKRNNRFFVEFPEEFKIHSWTVQKINKPKYSNGKWEDIKIIFIDAISPSTSQSLYNIIENLNINDSDNNKIFDIKIKSLDPTGVVVEEWIVRVESVMMIDFGELNYDDERIQEPHMVIKPLKCELKY